MKIILSILLLLPFNTYAEVNPEPILDTVVIQWVYFETVDEVHDYCSKNVVSNAKDDEVIIGCAEYNREGATCTIYAAVPKFVDDDERMDTLGHEVLHCFAGDFHKD
jgi:hypothetical protein